jgi:hypothetical protein
MKPCYKSSNFNKNKTYLQIKLQAEPPENTTNDETDIVNV